MSDEPTPRTDAVLAAMRDDGEDGYGPMHNLARELERELIATRAELEKLKDDLYHDGIERSLSE